MKKLFATLVAVVSLIGITLAQSNTANITQSGNLNKSSADQTGNNQYSTVEQTANYSPFFGFYNEAYVQQTGANHNSTIQQVGDQNGQFYFGNYADVNQSGENQRSSIYQSGKNKFTINGHVSTNVGAFVTQSGSNNQSTVEQRGSGNLINVNQFGQGDVASHIITAGAPRTNTITGRIDQVNIAGSENQAIQLVDASAQNGELRNSSLTIYQDGSRNQSTQTMHVAWGANNSMSAKQYGEDNSAVQSMDNLNGSNTSLSIDQGASGVNSNGNVAQQFSYKSNNTAVITQYSSGDAGSVVNNEAYQTMNDAGNTYTINQTGVLNYASQIANTSANNSLIMQTGDHNFSTVVQH